MPYAIFGKDYNIPTLSSYAKSIPPICVLAGRNKNASWLTCEDSDHGNWTNYNALNQSPDNSVLRDFDLNKGHL